MCIRDSLEHVEMARKVGMQIGMGMGDRIAHARLRAQMHDALEIVALERLDQRFVLREILTHQCEAITAQFGQTRQTGLFQADICLLYTSRCV